MQELFELFSSIDFGQEGNLLGLGSSAIIFLLGLLNFVSSGPKPKALKKEVEVKSEKPVTDTETKREVQTSLSWKDRLFSGLSQTRTGVWGKLENIFTQDKLDEDSLDQIEELLYSSDMSPEIVDDIIKNFKEQMNKEDSNFASFKAWAFEYLNSKLKPVQDKLDANLFSNKSDGLKVFMIVGVNGAGKTTTIGKLATKLKNSGSKVVVGACDTFRAAAVEQLEVWCDRAGVEMVKAQSGNDPSGVAYDTLSKAISLKADYCLLDTAGRLHNHSNLMDELAKTKRVLGKQMSDAPHQVLLVIDSITGQNAIKQAKAFNETLDLTGLVLTKCDGSSRAGNAVSISSELNVPIAYIGVGESVDDLEVFNSDDYLSALLGV